MSKVGLPIRPIPYSDESAGSLLIRAAQANHYRSVNQLLSGALKIEESAALDAHLTCQSRFGKIVQHLKLPDGSKELAFSRVGPTSRSARDYDCIPLPDRFFRPDARAYCAVCLRISPYWRRVWLLRPYAACVEHSCLLIVKCPNCSSRLSCSRGEIDRCGSCGHSLTKTDSRTVDSGSLSLFCRMMKSRDSWLLNHGLAFWSALERFDGGSSHPDAELDRVGLTMSYYLNQESVVTFLAESLKERASHAHPRIQLLPFLMATPALKSLAESTLLRTEKPPKVSEGLADMQSLSKSQACAALGISYAKLATLMRRGVIAWETTGGREQKVSTAIVDALLRDPQRVSAAKKIYARSVASTMPSGSLTVNEAATKLAVHPQIVRSLIQVGWLPASKTIICGSLKAVISEESLARFAERYVLVSPLAKKLGVNSTNLAEKLGSLGIRPVGGRGVDGLMISLFNRQDVAELTTDQVLSVTRYKTRTGRKSTGTDTTCGRSASSMVALTSSANRLGISIRQTSTLVQRGLLTRHLGNPLAVMIEEASLLALQDQLSRPDFVSKADAAAQLGISCAALSAIWVRSGIVEIYDFVYWKFVTKADLRKIRGLRRSYYTATEAGVVLGVEKSHINNLKKRGLLPPVKVGRGAALLLYRKADVEALLP